MSQRGQGIARLRSKQAVITIIGMDYVGLPLARRFSEEGYKVIGVDIDQAKIERLYRGEP
jgi:UDP-N-acetyl-D-glucosamine dehydrogenase